MNPEPNTAMLPLILVMLRVTKSYIAVTPAIVSLTTRSLTFASQIIVSSTTVS